MCGRSTMFRLGLFSIRVKSHLLLITSEQPGKFQLEKPYGSFNHRFTSAHQQNPGFLNNGIKHSRPDRQVLEARQRISEIKNEIVEK